MEYSLFELDSEIESDSANIGMRAIKIQSKIKTANRLKKENAQGVLSELPSAGESLHIVSNGRFDYFTLVPIAIDLLNGGGGEFDFST